MRSQPARRDILKYAGAITVGVSALATRSVLGEEPAGGHGPKISPDAKGVLVDLSECIGCRLCEYACKKSNGFETGTVASYDDMSVFAHQRRPGPTVFTVVNGYGPGNGTTRTADSVFTKVNCLHCNYAACVSACIVGALSKNENGAVEYDSWKCIGCRYCMVACPFQIPTYEYDNVLTPQVRKCELCPQRTSKGELPACVKECPRQVMTYGKRSELLEMAKRRIAANPGKYVDHIYGEHEVGGTSWMYISKVPFEQAGFLKLGTDAPPALTEAIQHGVFKHWIAPLGWYGFLGAMYWVTGRRNAAAVGAHATMSQREVVHAHAGGGADEADDEAAAPVEHEHAHHGHEPAEPVTRKLLTPGVWVLIAMVLTGVAFGLYRFIFGLAAATNLDQQHPWGLWIAMDVGSGIALAGGGFVTAALVHIFHREHYHAIARCALLTALLGYTFYVPGLLADLGRYYNLWHTMLPIMWQGNSVLFEVGMCVMIYLNVQYAELTPIICERFIRDEKKWPKVAAWAKRTHDLLEWIMPALLCLGVALSTFHQSSLGNLVVIAPYKLHRLWWSPVSPVLFLLSAMMVGFPMVIFTMIFGSWCLKRKPEMHVLAPLTRYVMILMFAYLGVKVGDVAVRGVWHDLLTPSVQGVAWIVEVAGGLVLPLILLLNPAVRRSARWLGIACLLIILGVVLNRLNVFIIGYRPPFAEKDYIPSITEMALSLGLVAGLMLVWRIAVTYLPILQPAPRVAGEEA